MNKSKNFEFKKSDFEKATEIMKNARKQTGEIELPYLFPGVNEYEKGWNDCIKEIKLINNIK